MTKEKLDKILADHKLWLNNEGGKKADLSRADLSVSDLRDANLSVSDLREADLRGANLREADLRGANLRGAYIDYSSWPLWCGSIEVKIDDRIAKQLVYHAMCNLDKKQMEKFLSDPIAYANGFHRVGEVPKIGG